MTITKTVFLPGLLTDAELWRAQVKALEGKIAPHFADLSRHDSIPEMARGVLHHAPPRFALVGLSMGGYVAFEILRQAPERVTRLFLFDTSARADTPEQQERRRLLLSMSGTGQFKGITPRLLPGLIHPSRLQDEALTDSIMRMAERMGQGAFRNQQTANMNRVDSRPFLKNITCPTHLAVGRQDALTPPDIMREIADEIPNSHMTVIENCGHLPPLEQPEKAVELLRAWL